MRGTIVRLFWLVIVWNALWEGLSAANVASGLLVSLALLRLFPLPGAPTAVVRPLAAARFLGYFAWKLVEASAIVAWEVVTPANRINEGIIAVPLRDVSQGVTVLVANAISLTPGTLTLEITTDPTVLYVHVLHMRNPESVRADVQRLEALASAAFGPPAGVEAHRAAVGRGDTHPGSRATTSQKEQP